MTMKPTQKLAKQALAFVQLTEDELTRALRALQRFERRQTGTERPEGVMDSAKRWYPSDAEDAGGEITRYHRSPSRSWPFSYYKACMTLKHCIALDETNAEAVRILKKYISNSLPEGEEVHWAYVEPEFLHAERLSICLARAPRKHKQPSKRI